ncbi:4'-phosphopantetheinyl transferase [Crassisporium funariophilum]|nr:4'-phosphopantetheinyl transferase [Crassisporium funariophilum]
MTILGIGVDIVHVPRIASLFTRRCPDRFALRILSKQEYVQWESLRNSDLSERVRFIAVRWSVKEASYKAMYPVVKPTWREFTYQSVTAEGRKPTLTHDGEYVYSSVLIEAPARDVVAVGQ